MDSMHATDATRQFIEQMPATIEQMPAAIAIFDGEMRYRAVSHRHLSDLEWLFSTEVLPPDKVIGRTFREVFPDMPARWGEAHERVLAGAELSQDEDFVPRPDGRAVWVRWSMKSWRDVQDRIAGALMVSEIVTQQVETRRALADSEERFRVTFKNAPVGIAHLSPDLRWLRVNDAFCHIHGYRADELTTKSLQDVVPLDDFAELAARAKQMRDGMTDRFQIDRRALQKDGTIIWVRVTIGCLRKSDGSIDYFVVVLEDISARRRTERELAESEARFRATFENAAVGISHVAPDGRFLRFNKALSRILVWPADELMTKSIWEITHPDDLASELAQFRLLEDGSIDSDSTEKRFLRKDGTTVWIRQTRSCVHKHDGSVDYFVGVAEDISARKLAERELAESEARFRATFENAAVGITHVAPDGRFLRFNKALSRLVGWPADELITKSVQEITHPDDRAADLAQSKQLEDGTVDSYSMEKRDLRKDGTIVWIRLTRSCVHKHDGSVDYFVGVIEDISARKRAEEYTHLLMREANHRAKNLLCLVQVIARQTAAGNPEDFVRRFSERIHALAANQDLLGRNQHQGVDLEDLVPTHLAHFEDLVGSRITALGPKLRLNAAAAQAIGLALHELATNAGKYGALSTDRGRVDIGWAMTDDTFTMSWTERSGPPVRPPERLGFGSTVIEAMVRQAVSGEVQLNYASRGLEWRLTCPAANALEP